MRIYDFFMLPVKTSGYAKPCMTVKKKSPKKLKEVDRSMSSFLFKKVWLDKFSPDSHWLEESLVSLQSAKSNVSLDEQLQKVAVIKTYSFN